MRAEIKNFKIKPLTFRCAKEKLPDLGKYWNKICPDKSRPCSIPDTEDVIVEKLKEAKQCKPFAKKLAAVMRKWHDEVRDQCFFDITCVIHDRCFLIVDNELETKSKKISYSSCNTDMKRNMDAITTQMEKDGKSHVDRCKGRAEMIKLAVDIANGCESMSCKFNRLKDELRRNMSHIAFYKEFKSLLKEISAAVGASHSDNIFTIIWNLGKAITTETSNWRCVFGVVLSPMTHDEDACH